MKTVENWNFKGNKVVYEYEDGTSIEIERDLFYRHTVETDFYFVYISEDDGYIRSPTEEEYQADVLEMDRLDEDGITSIVPFNRRGKIIIETNEQAELAALNFSNYIN